ncbi:hypothetical protein B0H17DRAFT_1216939 [Mycena rosella]|uniref:Uncharacterized protein n=1 Tax=Mycena rosella TaxID=1033263 RepID=A0AAD7FQJ4_MYCRO|nr:hypothetical protein B0H17DRAFT_1216939 [Mycena rosella]
MSPVNRSIHIFAPELIPMIKCRKVDPFDALMSVSSTTSFVPFFLAAAITQVVLELSLYGAFAVLFSAVVYLFWSRGLLAKNRPIFLVFLALVVLFLPHVINTVYALYFAFVHLGGGVAATVFYLTEASPTDMADISFVAIVIIITDSLVIHRLYVVWSCNYRVVIFPIIILLVQVVSGAHVIHDLAVSTQVGPGALFSPWVIASYASSFIVSGYSSAMIGYKIVTISRSLRRLTGSATSGKRLMRVLVIMIESSALQASPEVQVAAEGG